MIKLLRAPREKENKGSKNIIHLSYYPSRSSVVALLLLKKVRSDYYIMI